VISAIAALWLAWTARPVSAQPTFWQPSAGHTQVPIWPATSPAARQGAEPETTGIVRSMVAGRPWRFVARVSQPTLTVYPPKGKNTGAAVVVFPGGGYQVLAIDLEGTEVCDWLTSSGITCVLLKYRVPNTGPTWDQHCGCDRETRSSKPLEDAQRTVGLVRARATEWHVDPHKVGVLGFSAGGHLVAAVSTHFERRTYEAVDAADSQSCRPDFAVALYPGHLSDYTKPELMPDLHVTKDSPPTFLLHAQNDNVDAVHHSLVYYEALKDAGVPAELHVYAEGGHAFGLRPTKQPITAWPRLVETWLQAIGMTSP
jgi:acetyl esterase/lipase